MSSEEHNFSKLSYLLTNTIDKKIKKKDGIYFTPPKTINYNFNILEPFIKNVKTALEPSCGSCEYLQILNKKNPDIKITGIELNKQIFDSIHSMESKNVKLYNADFLTFNFKIKYDLIFGNPPFYVLKKKEVSPEYYKYFDGRPNIFILFIIKSLSLLNDNGILSFVLPKNFLNCLYYNNTRKYICDNFEILSIHECNDTYIETQQETIILNIRKSDNKSKNNEFILSNKYIIFSTPENILKINSLYDKSTTLYNMGFKVIVGNVVWNQCKKELTDDNTKTLLIYSSDIEGQTLKIKKYSNVDKKNYINKEGQQGPILVINRGYGVGNYTFNYCLINEDFDYLIENHLICIKYTKEITNTKLIKEYKKIIKSFDNKKTKDFIELYFGNNAINTTELCEILPIYDE